MSLFLNLMRILAEEDLQNMDEEEFFELLENENWREVEELIERETKTRERVLH